MLRRHRRYLYGQRAVSEPHSRRSNCLFDEDTGYTATMLHYAGQFPVKNDVFLEDGTTEPASVTLALTARLAVWHDGRDVLMGGGVSPADPVAEALKASVSPDVTFAEDPIENETLSAHPDTFTEAIETLIVAME